MKLHQFKYVANPVVVTAYIIQRVVLKEDGTEIWIYDGEEKPFHCSHEMTARYQPLIGDYFVVQEDGYVYLNPKAVFERKYSPMQIEECPGFQEAEIS